MSTDSLLSLMRQARRHRRSDPERGLVFALQAEAAARQSQESTILLDALLSASECLLEMEQDTELLTAKLEEAHQLSAEIANPGYRAECHYLRGWLNLLLHQPLEAERAFQQALEWLDQTQLVEWKVVTLRSLGCAYIDLGRYPAALRNLLEALSLGEEIGFDRIDRFFFSHGHLDQAAIFHNIAIVYSNMDQFARAISYYEIALALYEKNRPSRAAKTLYNMGIAAYEMQEYDDALAYYQRSYELELRHGTDNDAAVALSGIAEVYVHLGQLDQAWPALQEAEGRLAADPINRPYYADILWAMGDCRLQQGHPAEALTYYQKVSVILEETGRAKGQAAHIYEKMSLAHRAMGQFEQALDCYERFHLLQAQHLEESWTEQMRQVMVQFDTERAMKDREMLHLHSKELEREIAERKAAQRALAKAKAELEERNRELAILSRRDPLTGLHNRRFLDETIDLLIHVGGKIGEPLSVALCDIDDFKQINDSRSHSVGDEVLRVVAQIFQANLRRSDVVVRYGGEEFVAVFPNTDDQTAAGLIERIRDEVSHYDWESIAPGMQVTLSAGVAMQVQHRDGASLLHDADICLYTAKHQGKDQVIATNRLVALA